MSLPPESEYDLFAGSGEVHSLLRNEDFVSSLDYPPQDWPQTLRNMVGLILDCKFPMFVLWGEKHNCLYNDAYIPILDDRHPTAFGAPFQEIFPEIWADCATLIERAYAGDSVFIEDFPLVIARHGHPEQTYFTFSYSPIREESGAIVGMYCVCNETTEKVLVEKRQAFNLSMADHLRLLSDPAEIMAKAAELLAKQLAADRVVFADLDGATGKVTYHTNYSEGVLTPVVGDWNITSFGRSMGELLQSGQTQVYEDVFLDHRTNDPGALKNFALIKMRSGIVVSAFRQGDLVSALIVGHSKPRIWRQYEIILVEDVAARAWKALERSRAEEARVKQRAAETKRMRSIFEQAPGFVALVTEPNHVFALVNVAYYQLVGHREIVGKPVREALPEVEGQGFFEMLDRVYRTGEEVVGRAQTLRVQRHLNSEPEERVVDFVFQPVRDANGDVYGVIAQGNDVTERVEAERAVRELNETLEERVAARTAELEHAHEQLRQSQKMEAVGQLTGGLAHDFNNILASVVANLELMQLKLAQGRTSDLARHIEGAMAASERAIALTHRLLAFSRRQTLAPKVLDVNELVTSMVGMIQGAVGPSVQVITELEEAAWKTKCDVNQLENTLLNLAINARDAMPNGGTLTIATANSDKSASSRATPKDAPAGRHVLISVTDTGTGMTEEVASRAFDPFFTTKPIGQGTGLGLSMIFGFVKQSGGHIRLHSAVGRGTSVCVYLPCHEGEIDAAVDRAPQAEVEPFPAAATVLVIDDERALRELLCEALRDLGYTTVEAGAAQEGLE